MPRCPLNSEQRTASLGGPQIALSHVSASQVVIQGVFSTSSPSLFAASPTIPSCRCPKKGGVLWQGASGMCLKLPCLTALGALAWKPLFALDCPPAIWILDYSVGSKRQLVPQPVPRSCEGFLSSCQVLVNQSFCLCGPISSGAGW